MRVKLARHRAQDLQGGWVVEPRAAAALIAEGGHGKGLHAGRLHEAVAAQVPRAPACTRKAVLNCMPWGKHASAYTPWYMSRYDATCKAPGIVGLPWS